MSAKWNMLTRTTGALSACLAIDLIVVVGTATVGISQTSPAPLKNRPSSTEQPAQPGKEAQRALRTWSVTRAARAARERRLVTRPGCRERSGAAGSHGVADPTGSDRAGRATVSAAACVVYDPRGRVRRYPR